MLPPGLTLNPATGSISGTPSSAGRYAFIAEAADTNGAAASGEFVIEVARPPLTITSASLPAGMAGRP